MMKRAFKVLMVATAAAPPALAFLPQLHHRLSNIPITSLYQSSFSGGGFAENKSPISETDLRKMYDDWRRKYNKGPFEKFRFQVWKMNFWAVQRIQDQRALQYRRSNRSSPPEDPPELNIYGDLTQEEFKNLQNTKADSSSYARFLPSSEPALHVDDDDDDEEEEGGNGNEEEVSTESTTASPIVRQSTRIQRRSSMGVSDNDYVVQAPPSAQRQAPKRRDGSSPANFSGLPSMSRGRNLGVSDNDYVIEAPPRAQRPLPARFGAGMREGWELPSVEPIRRPIPTRREAMGVSENHYVVQAPPYAQRPAPKRRDGSSPADLKESSGLPSMSRGRAVGVSENDYVVAAPPKAQRPPPTRFGAEFRKDSEPSDISPDLPQPSVSQRGPMRNSENHSVVQAPPSRQRTDPKRRDGSSPADWRESSGLPSMSRGRAVGVSGNDYVVEAPSKAQRPPPTRFGAEVRKDSEPSDVSPDLPQPSVSQRGPMRNSENHNVVQAPPSRQRTDPKRRDGSSPADVREFSGLPSMGRGRAVGVSENDYVVEAPPRAQRPAPTRLDGTPYSTPWTRI